MLRAPAWRRKKVFHRHDFLFLFICLVFQGKGNGAALLLKSFQHSLASLVLRELVLK